jgi:hypothetical protein
MVRSPAQRVCQRIDIGSMLDWSALHDESVLALSLIFKRFLPVDRSTSMVDRQGALSNFSVAR